MNTFVKGMFDFVCPTYVGMNRTRTPWTTTRPRMPHVCGDEPDIRDLADELERSMPHVGGDEPSIDIGEYVAP